ncbi:MAG: protein kinase [Desulfobacterales bacterium]|nr:protein kinase [Desulfobacterales bacterium]
MNDTGGMDPCPHCRSPLIFQNDQLSIQPRTILNRKYLIGKSSFCSIGVTYLAMDILLKRRVVIKEFLPGIMAAYRNYNQTQVLTRSDCNEDYEYYLSKFKEETQALAKLRHSGIVPVTECFKENNTAYMVMLYIPGKTLEEYVIEQKGCISEKELLKIMIPVLEGLKAAHHANILHRNINPSNIFVPDEGKSMLLDFCIENIIWNIIHKTDIDIQFPHSGGAYRPIEQWLPKNTGTYTDIYACAATMYSCLRAEIGNGRITPPIHPMDINNNERILPHIKEEVSQPISHKLANAIMEGMELEPSMRPQTVSEFQKKMDIEPQKNVEPLPIDPNINLCMGCMEFKGDEAVCNYCGYIEQEVEENTIYLKTGTILKSHYIIGKVLGQGGFGITYIGFDMNLHRKVAIKEYFPTAFANRNVAESTVMPLKGDQEQAFYHGRKLFIKEARNIARFKHPSIVTINNYFEMHNTGYMVMDYLEGGDLSSFLKERGGKLSLDESLEILFPILDALDEVHSDNMYHLDISPQNILFNVKGTPILIDFGAAKQVIGEESRSMDIIFKPGYAPMEQYTTKKNIGPWTDIYACGATLYKMITGKLPPVSPDRIYKDDLIQPSDIEGLNVSKELNDAILHALAVRYEDRFRSVGEFREALGAIDEERELPIVSSRFPELKSTVSNYLMKVTTMKPKVFISYVKEDFYIADKLYNDLKKNGVKPWMNKKDNFAGQNWKKSIRREIKKSTHFLALMSSNSVSKSGFFQSELKLAIELHKERIPSEIFIIPVHLDNTPIPYDDYEELEEIKYVDIPSPSFYERGLEEVFDALKVKRSVHLPTNSFLKRLMIPISFVFGVCFLLYYIFIDTTPPTGRVEIKEKIYTVGDEVEFNVEAEDNRALKRVSFGVGNLHLESWKPKKPGSHWKDMPILSQLLPRLVYKKSVYYKSSFSTRGWKPETYKYSLLIGDGANNYSECGKGDFVLVDVFEVDDMVRVKQNVKKPCGGWQNLADPDEVGTVANANFRGKFLLIDFPSKKNWTACKDEIEKVQK